MPLPKPKKDEPRPDFMSRCMANLKDEYGDNKQRSAICYSQWKKSSIVPVTGFRRNKMEVTQVNLQVSGSPLEFDEIKTAFETRGINSKLFRIKNKIEDEDEDEYQKLVKANTLRFVGSSPSPDRHGDVVNAKGWNLDNFKKNPVFLWQHNQNEAPIGNSINEFVDEEKGLVMDIFFHGLTEKSAEALMLYNAGVMKGVSVGFRPLELKEMDDEERKDLGMSPFGTYYESQELLELSAVSIPANPDALLETQKDVAGLVMKKLVDEHGEVFEGFKQLTEKLDKLEEKLESSAGNISKINSIENRLEIVETKKTLSQQNSVEKSDQDITCDEIEALFADKFKI